MRTRKLLYPAEKVWVDKHKYDEAERLHYEREAALAASAAGTCQEVVAVNGFYHDDEPVEEELKGDLHRTGNEKKQKRRKCSPRAKSLNPKVDFVLAGLLADHVWFDKPLFDQAETAYRKKLSDELSQAAPEKLLAAKQSALLPWSEVDIQGVKPRRNLTLLQCAHGGLIACHHVIQDVWVNKFNFDDAEKGFVEQSQVVVLPHFLDLPSVPLQSNKASVGQTTPDEGYVTALPTPSTPAVPAQSMEHTGVSFVSPSLPDASNQTVNGKPQISSLQALISEVWLEKPIYDDAERCFYANMFDGHPPGKVRLQERGRPESSKRSRKDKKSRSAVKQTASKRGNYTLTVPQDATRSPPTWYFMHKDSESSWLSKPIYDSAEAQYYASKALTLANKPESTKSSETTLAKPSQPPARASSAPESNTKKMAASFLMHDKIWFDKFRYDDAEKRYYEQMNGPVINPSCHQKRKYIGRFDTQISICDLSIHGFVSTQMLVDMGATIKTFKKEKKENGASTILRDIARARENIQKSLAGLKTVLQNPHEASPPRRKKRSGRATSVSSTSSAGPAGDQSELVTRIASLEAENQNLHSVVTDLQLAISRLETRLSVLEKASTSHHPSPIPPTQVQPLSTSSRKVELPSASAKKVESVAEDEDDDDIDLFGSDDEEEDQEAARVREERLQQYAAKKSKKPGLIAKSSILLDVKPWDDETDMAKMEECVRSIQMDGLVWGASKLVPVGYGIKKLQIQCVVEDDKVGTDILEEEITKFEDHVQSVDIAAFNKI